MKRGFWLLPCLAGILAAAGACTSGPTTMDNPDGSMMEKGPRSLWSRRFGGPEDDVARVAVDKSGNVVVTGGFQVDADFGGGRVTALGGVDVFLARYGADGSYKWSKGMGGSGPDLAMALAVDDTGGAVIAGSFQGVADFGGGPLPSAGDADVFIAKYDASGKHLWSRRFGGPLADAATAVAIDRGGNVLLAGGFTGVIDLGGGPVPPLGDTGVFIAKYDGSGKHLWSRRIAGPGIAAAAGVYAADNGDLLVAGSFEEAGVFGGDHPLPSVGAKDIFVARYAARDGAHVWSQRFGGPQNDIAAALVVDSAGNVAVTGSFEQVGVFGGDPLPSIGASDIFLARYDGSGKHLWSRRGGGPGADSAYGLAVGPGDSLVVTGSFKLAAIFGGDPLSSFGDDDVFVARFSAGGQHQFSRRFGGPQADDPTSAAVDQGGNVMVAGSFHATADFGGDPLVSAGKADAFLMRLAP